MNGSRCFPSLAASIYFPALLGFKDAHGLDEMTRYQNLIPSKPAKRNSSIPEKNVKAILLITPLKTYKKRPNVDEVQILSHIISLMDRPKL
ncbi:hypothetical protein Peur_020210 [Populus x canadensis]